MARHTIQVPINKSSNDNERIYTSQSQYILPDRVSEYLYTSFTRRSFDGSTLTDLINNIGIGWDSNSIPANKDIVSASLKIYATKSFPTQLIYKFADFTEGGTILRPTPPDGNTSTIQSGWNTINLNVNLLLPNNSLTLGTPSEVRTDYGKFHSHRNATNKPYLEITYDDIPPSPPTSLYPSNITLNPREVIRFSWSHNSNEDNPQTGFTLQYSTNGGSTWTTVNQTTSNQYYDMPANTLPTSGTVVWRVLTKEGTDSSGYSTTAQFALGTPPQEAPIPIAPIGQYLDSTKPILFEWNFMGGTPGETQSKFDLQYSTNGGSTWTTKTIVTADTFYELPANTFNTGNVLWRVRTYNNHNEVSPYSENKSFYVIGSPPIPQITNVTNSARPTITWTSQGQQIYELQILKGSSIIVDTGAIPGVGDRTYKVDDYLQDGNYKVKLRVMNEYSLYSEWAENNFVINTVKPTKPEFEILRSRYGVELISSLVDANVLVYRDNEYIGDMRFGYFEDLTGSNNKEHEYFLRLIENDNFNDSDIIKASCGFRGNTLSMKDNPRDLIVLEYGLDDIPKKSSSYNNIGSLIYFDGRKYPVAEFSEFESYNKTLGFFVKTKEEVDRLIELISKKETLVYRDNNGENIIGVVLELPQIIETILGYEIGFTIVRTEV